MKQVISFALVTIFVIVAFSIGTTGQARGASAIKESAYRSERITPHPQLYYCGVVGNILQAEVPNISQGFKINADVEITLVGEKEIGKNLWHYPLCSIRIKPFILTAVGESAILMGARITDEGMEKLRNIIPSDYAIYISYIDWEE